MYIDTHIYTGCIYYYIKYIYPYIPVCLPLSLSPGPSLSRCVYAYVLGLCVHSSVCACARVCVNAYAYVCVRACVHLCVCACVRTNKKPVYHQKSYFTVNSLTWFCFGCKHHICRVLFSAYNMTPSNCTTSPMVSAAK